MRSANHYADEAERFIKASQGLLLDSASDRITHEERVHFTAVARVRVAQAQVYATLAVVSQAAS
jgi:hypothetical protein